MSWLKPCFPHHKRTYIQVLTSVQAVSETIQSSKICRKAFTVHLKSALHRYLVESICYSPQLTRSPHHLPNIFLCHLEVNPPVSHLRLTLSLLSFTYLLMPRPQKHQDIQLCPNLGDFVRRQTLHSRHSAIFTLPSRMHSRIEQLFDSCSAEHLHQTFKSSSFNILNELVSSNGEIYSQQTMDMHPRILIVLGIFSPRLQPVQCRSSKQG